MIRKNILTGICLAGLGAMSVQPANAELIGHWSLDEGKGIIANDSVYGKSGVWQADAKKLEWVPGKIGAAIKLSGAGDPWGHFYIPDVHALTGNNAFSICGWIKPAKQNYHYNSVMMSRDVIDSSYGAHVFGFAFEKSHIDGRFANDVVDSKEGLKLDNWYHVAVVGTGSKGKKGSIVLYINGKEASRTISNYPITNIISSKHWCIGSEGGPGIQDWASKDRTFAGLIDDLQIYDTPLSAFEVGKIYQAGTKGRSFTVQKSDTPKAEKGKTILIGGDLRNGNFNDINKYDAPVVTTLGRRLIQNNSYFTLPYWEFEQTGGTGGIDSANTALKSKAYVFANPVGTKIKFISNSIRQEIPKGTEVVLKYNVGTKEDKKIARTKATLVFDEQLRIDLPVKPVKCDKKEIWIPQKFSYMAPSNFRRASVEISIDAPGERSTPTSTQTFIDDVELSINVK